MATENGNRVAEKIDNQNPEAAKKKTLTITLRSSDGHEFVVSESAAVLSVTIKNMVEDECTGNVIPLPLVDGGTLAMVVTYLNKHAKEGVSDDEKRKFDELFVSGKELGVLFDVVLAANYLNIKDLLDMLCQKIADTIKNKDVRCVREIFGIENDFTPEEEQLIRDENAWAWEGVEPNYD
ncbi:hypothetical protein Pfo_015606 [Paulownia fortunei]|nr:hypothetical protein Pfo_015606 [Paulownia fortunei]